MQTTVRVKLSEIDASLLERLRLAFAKLSNAKDPEVDIVLHSSLYDADFMALMEKSVTEMEEGKTVVFTMDSLTQFAKS